MITIEDLLKESKGQESLYLRIGNLLYHEFNIQCAEITLVILHIYNILRKEEINAKYGTFKEKVYVDTDSIKVERDCKHCNHHKECGCEVWDCEYEPKESEEEE